MRARLQRAWARVQRAPGATAALAAVDRDRRRGGGLLAGALAFRLFAALLPLALLVAVALGYASSVSGDAADAVGMRRALLESFAQSSTLDSGARWTVVVGGLGALLWSATSAARAIRSAHVLAWEGGVGRFTRPLGAGLVLIVAVAGFAAVWGVVGWARANLGVAGLIISFAAILPFIAMWLGVAWLLPHGGASWTALLPGALLRLLALPLSAIPLCAGFLLILVDRRRRALHDRLVRTVVVYAPAEARAARRLPEPRTVTHA